MTTTVAVETSAKQAPEARTGLDPWRIKELPPAPVPRGLGWFSAIGPGVIVLGVSIGSGEFLLGPAAFVKYGLSLLWVVGVAALLRANDDHLFIAQPGEAAYDGTILGEQAVAVQLAKVGERGAEVIKAERTFGVPGELDPLPRGEIRINLPLGFLDLPLDP